MPIKVLFICHGRVLIGDFKTSDIKAFGINAI